MFSDFNLTNIVIILVSLLVSMTVHEYMHAYVGLKLGDTTAYERGRISLNPLQHIDPVMTILLPAITLLLFHAPILAAKPVPFDPEEVRHGEFGVALLALAGPFANLVLAFVAALGLHFIQTVGVLGYAMQVFIELNVALFIFNLLPIPPLDGSRVLYAFAPEPIQDFMRAIEPYGLIIIFAGVLWGGASGLLANLNIFVLNLLP